MRRLLSSRLMSPFWFTVALVAALNASPLPQVTAPIAAPANPFAKLLPNLRQDLRSLATLNSAVVMGVGSAGALAAHNSDVPVHDWAIEQPQDPALARFGNVYGDAFVQGGLAIAAWAAGKQQKNIRLETTGSDLIRAQILNGVLTVPLKTVVNRERPNGGHHSFPSGHTSATFATAAVIQRDYGVGASVPFYALGGIVTWSRIRTSHHWLSDGVFGAAIGITSGLAVTKGRTSHWSVVPVKTAGGAALYVVRR
jgi:hypothetical protein